MPDLKEFWAVTTTSIYHIKWFSTINQLVIKKIGIANKSDTPVDAILQGGLFLGIAKSYLVKFGTLRIPPEQADKRREWGSTTSPIVGLFLNEDDAVACLKSGELTALNPRWRQLTEETVKAIGPDHPVFVFSENDPICFN